MDNQPNPTPETPQAPAPPPTPTVASQLDIKTVTTIKWSAIWFAVSSAIRSFAVYISLFFVGGLAGELISINGFFDGFFSNFILKSLISAIIWGAVIGAAYGFFIAKMYPQLQEWNKQYLKGKINTMFKLLFYVPLAASLVQFLFMGGIETIRFLGIVPFLVIIGGIILGSFIYAKMLNGKISSMYPPMVNPMSAPTMPTPPPPAQTPTA